MLSSILSQGRVKAERPAIIEPAGTVVDYGTLAARVSSVAAAIRSEYGCGRFIVTRPDASADAIVAVLAIMASDNTVVPIGDTVRGEQLEYIRAKCRDAVVFDPPLNGCAADAMSTGTLSHERDPAMVLFTSGTTGQPKGVLVTPNNLDHSCREIAAYLGYREHDSAAVILPLHYSYSLISQVFAQLAVGGSVHLFGSLRNPIKVARVINERSVRVFSGVPSTFAALAMMHRMQSITMPEVRVVCSAGAPFDLTLYDTIKEIFPGARVFNNYGATEATPRISYVADDDPSFFEGSCGRPMTGVEVVAVEPSTRRVLGDGERGIIAVRGANVTPGYLDDTIRTTAAFTSEGYFLTNDLGYVRNGSIHVQGRVDDIFDVSGEKVSPGEIEQALMSFPEIERSAVVGHPDSTRGHVPVAFVKMRSTLAKAELNRRLSQVLAPIKIPVRYYRIESFPETVNGKLMRRELLTGETDYMRNEIS